VREKLMCVNHPHVVATHVMKGTPASHTLHIQDRGYCCVCFDEALAHSADIMISLPSITDEPPRRGPLKSNGTPKDIPWQRRES